jgi:hypothetical protein
MRASAEAMLYSLTGIEQHAVDCKADVVAAFALIDANNHWANPSLKGLTSYWYATRTAMCYDLCYHSPSWDSTLRADVSARLLSIATMIINNGGTEQNTQFSSNWQANRASSGGIALLATDESYDAALMDSAMLRLNNFFNFNQGSGTRGWNPEGTGYTAYLYGSFVGPFAIALDRLEPARSISNQAGMKWMPWTAFAGAVPATANNPYNVYGLGGVKTDWSDDNAHIGGEGLYGLAFRFSPPSLLPGLRHAYDRLQGSLAPDGGRWDASRHGIFWSILYYPENTPPQNPLEIGDWQDANAAPVGLGLVTFRDGFRGENDILVHFKARTKVVDSNSHDGPDGLGFRILGPNAPFVVGGGRDNPGRDRNQATVYPNDPNISPAANKNAGTYHGTPLIKPDGGGHAIASMSANNVGTTTHKRWIVTDFDRATTGADATVIVADTTGNGRFWQLPTYLNNTVTVTGSIFTITGENGATLQGTIIHPGGTPLVSIGTKARGDGYTLENGGTLPTESAGNPRILSNRYLYIENTTDSDFLVVMTIQKNGGRHPVVARNGGTIADAVIQVGGRSYRLQTDTVFYDGAPYIYPDSTVTFAAGPNGSVSGSTVQTVVRGAAATAPTATPDAGFQFAGWNKTFNKVTTPMTVTALFTPTGGPAPTLALASSSWRVDEAAGTLSIGVTRSGDLTGAVGVGYATADGSATAGEDYTPATGTLAWADGDGETKIITIPILNDAILEMDEDFTVSLSAPTGGAVLTDPASALVTISDDESLPVQSTLAFTNQNLPILENAGSVTVSVARLLSSAGAVTVNYSTSPGTASSGVDYSPVSGTLSWADGEAGIKSFTVPIIDDLLVEANEAFTVNLTDPTGGAVLGSPSAATVTILENEVNVQPSITLDRPSSGVAALSRISQSLQLAATTSDDGEPGPLTFLWEKISGPGAVVFGNATSEDTDASFNLAGVYQLRLTATDGLLSDSKIVLVNVAASGGINQRLAEYPFTHAANDPTPLTPTVIGSNMSVTPVSVVGVPVSDSAANVLRLVESGGSGGLSTGFSNSTDHIWFRLDADPGYHFDLTTASAPRLQFQMGRVSAPAGTNIVGRMQVWAAATGSATTASTLVYTSSEILPTSSTLVTMNDTGGIAALNSTNRYTSLLVQVQWRGTATSTFGTLTMDNILVDGAVVAAVDNVGPITYAGPDTTAQINSAFPLGGSATDDGQPASPGALTYLWRKLSGPGNVIFADAGNPATTATFDSTGIHVLSLTADDGAIATSDTVTITVTSDVPLPPAPASGLSANAIAHNRIDLTWIDNASDETGFKILRSLTSGGGFAEIATTTANATSYSDTSCLGETTYFYQIVATNVTGDSAPSNEATATTPAAPPPTPGTIRLSAATYQAAENAASVTITAQRLDGVDGEVSVSYATTDGSATAGSDYTAASGTLNWPDGDAADKTVVITLLDDFTFEGNETFTLALTNATSGATLGTPSNATVTILDNEVDPTPTPTTIVVTPANPEVAANASQQFSAVLNDQFGQPITPQPSFAWSISGGGSINSAGLFTAVTGGGGFSVSATAASLTGSAIFTVIAGAGNGVTLGAFYTINGGSLNSTGVNAVGTNMTASGSSAYDGALAQFAAPVTLDATGDRLTLTFVTESLTTNNNQTWSFRYGLFNTNGNAVSANDQTAATDLWTGYFAVRHTTSSAISNENTGGTADHTANSLFKQATGTARVIAEGVGGGFGAFPTANGVTQLIARNAGDNAVGGADGTDGDFRSADLPITVTLVLERVATGLQITTTPRFTAGGNRGSFTFTDTAPTTYTFNAIAFGSINHFRVDDVVVSAALTPPPPASGYATWSATAFPLEATPEERAPGFDFDHDGLSNLLEYGLGSDPATASTTPAPQVVEITGQEYLQIQWTRPNNRTDITTHGEITNDLMPVSWTTDPGEVLTTITPAGEGLETVTIRDAEPFSAHTRRFLRARIFLNTP